MKKYLWLAVPLIVFLIGGCLKMDQEITLNKDGSGKIEIVYGMSEQTINQMKAMAEMAQQMAPEGEEAPKDDSFEFDPAQIKEGFKGLKDKGITLESVKTEKKDGWQYVNMVVAFKDISKIKDVPEMGNSPLTVTKDASGNYIISSGMSGDSKMGQGMQNPEQMKAMLPMFKGMRISMKINTPTSIIETNAPIKEKRSAQWVIDVDKDPDSISKLSKMDMKVVFDGKGCSIPEVK